MFSGNRRHLKVILLDLQPWVVVNTFVGLGINVKDIIHASNV